MELKIDDFFEKSLIFKDRSVFTNEYIPDRLLYRDKELKTIGRAFAGLMEGVPGHIWVNGPPSTGKTNCIKKLATEFNAYAETKHQDVKYCYASAGRKTIPRFYNEILQSLNPDAKNIEGNSLKAMDGIVKEAKKFKGVNFILDEIDRIAPTAREDKPIERIIGTFSRLHEYSSAFKTQYMITIVTNTTAIYRELSQATTSSFCATNIFFPEYSIDELKEILYERCLLGFQDGVIDKNTSLGNLASMIFQSSKDVRAALKILKEAGRIAEEQKDKKIQIKHIISANTIVEKQRLPETVSKLNDGCVALLLSISLFEKRQPGKKPTSDNVYQVYYDVVEDFDTAVISKDTLFYDIANKLSSMDMIEVGRTSEGYKQGVKKTLSIKDKTKLKEIISVCENELNSRKSNKGEINGGT